MIKLTQFYGLHQKLFKFDPDGAKKKVLKPGPTEALFLVAGPGTGKTAALTLRILKLILVDDVPPHAILATTFTNKAAAELRSRILGWGFRMVDVLRADTDVPGDVRARVAGIDINQVVTGTIDSICEALLRDHREAGAQPPVLADEFVAGTMLLREGLLGDGRYRNPHLDRFLFTCSGRTGKFGWNVGAKADVLHGLWDRRFHDQVDWKAFVTKGPKAQKAGRAVAAQALEAYATGLEQRGLVDFAQLEQRVLEGLQEGRFSEVTDQLQVVLVDEYQDTNLLQERIFFALAGACDGALTVVGDDDQSLFRFRGATVELFSEYEVHYEKQFRRRPRRIFLATSYRSTYPIVGFVRDYARLDKGYQRVRVARKPKLESGPKKRRAEVPVLGLFRDNPEMLADALAKLIHDVFCGRGYGLPRGGKLKCDRPNGGDVGDCAFLASSPREYGAADKERLPLLLRRALAVRGIRVFNPRGEDLTEVPMVELFGGLVLECLDPGAEVATANARRLYDAVSVFDGWRNRAIHFTEQKCNSQLRDYAVGWAERKPRKPGYEWPRSSSVLDLLYGLVHFLPKLHDDPEGQVYLEVFTRQLAACEQIGRFKARLVHDVSDPGLSQASVKELLLDFLAPIATGTTKINEDLIETFPRNRVNILSIHQAKGLEFPLVIVDVGSEFKTAHAAQSFKRFPEYPDGPQVMEDLMRGHTPLGKPDRRGLDRAFDDLFRQFFVAFSRPRQALVLVGRTSALPSGYIPNIAVGWTRDRRSTWRKRPPFVLI